MNAAVSALPSPLPQYYPPAEAGTLFEGLIETTELGEGFILHRVDGRDMQGISIRGITKPGLRIGLVVGGKIELSIGGRRWLLGPQAPGNLCGTMLSVAEPADFMRRSCYGDVERTVSITMSPDWLQSRLDAEAGPGLDFLGRHLSLRSWPISATSMALVDQMLSPAALAPSLWRMYLEARALELVTQALANLGGAKPAAAQAYPRKRERVRMEQVRDLLDSGQADNLGLDQIARQACVSVNTLQRQFKAVWGVTVVAYLRASRLARARRALERDGISVEHAAWLAGYTCPANFATAFRRRYGLTPRQAGSES